MTRPLRLGVPAMALVLCACAGAPSGGPSIGSPAGRPLVVPLGGDPDVYARLVAERARQAEVVYLGELHDNPRAHAVQAAILRTILATGGRPAVAFEMLAATDQAAMESAVASAESEAEVERRLRWHERGWPDFSMYWPLFELARRDRLPVVATDLDPAVVRRITRQGLAALRDEDASDLTSRLPPDPARDRTISRRMQADHCNLLPEARIPRMLESWYARNVTIARHVAGALGLAPQVVVIIGRGHQSPGGVPAQVAALRPGTRQLVVAVVEPSAGDSYWGEAADVVWRIGGVERPDPCLGLRRRLAEWRIE